MKILVFEFITGGGFCKQDLPQSLSTEGAIMLRALMNDLLSLAHIEIVLMLDWRMLTAAWVPESDRLQVVEIKATMDVDAMLQQLTASCDAVWPIAPESENMLADICRLIETSGKYLLSSSVDATVIAGDKYETFKTLKKKGIATVATALLSDFNGYVSDKWVIKPVDGVGCSQTMLISSERDYQLVRSAISADTDFIIQPYIPGKALSVSCLFKRGRAWLLCCNEQLIELEGNHFKLRGCLVNVQSARLHQLQQLIAELAAIMPGLWGYIGIDLIMTEKQLLVLEINPRLTTSYAGIAKALGLNVAENILQLIDGEPVIRQQRNNCVTVAITQERSYA